MDEPDLELSIHHNTSMLRLMIELMSKNAYFVISKSSHIRCFLNLIIITDLSIFFQDKRYIHRAHDNILIILAYFFEFFFLKRFFQSTFFHCLFFPKANKDTINFL